MKKNTALIVMDVQKGFDNQEVWGGNRNNPGAEKIIRKILDKWREKEMPIFHIIHDSILKDSILKISRQEGEVKDEINILDGENIVYKKVNSAFIGTNLDLVLRRSGINSIVIVGLTTNHCVSTTARMGGNLGYEVFVVDDATATFDRKDYEGNIYSSEIIHKVSLANIHDEFCTVLSSTSLLKMTEE